MYKLPLIVVLSAVMAGCAPMSTITAHHDSGVSIKHTQSLSDRVIFYDVQYEIDSSGQSVIFGLLKRTDIRHLHTGHIDYQLITKDGQIIEAGSVSYSDGLKETLPTKPSIKNRFKKRHAHFSIPLKHHWQPDQYDLHLSWDDASHPA